jgi:hypothetical protein
MEDRLALRVKSAACSARVGDRTGCWIMLAKEMKIVLGKQYNVLTLSKTIGP